MLYLSFLSNQISGKGSFGVWMLVCVFVFLRGSTEYFRLTRMYQHGRRMTAESSNKRANLDKHLRLARFRLSARFLGFRRSDPSAELEVLHHSVPCGPGLPVLGSANGSPKAKSHCTSKVHCAEPGRGICQSSEQL